MGEPQPTTSPQPHGLRQPNGLWPKVGSKGPPDGLRRPHGDPTRSDDPIACVLRARPVRSPPARMEADGSGGGVRLTAGPGESSDADTRNTCFARREEEAPTQTAAQRLARHSPTESWKRPRGTEARYGGRQPEPTRDGPRCWGGGGTGKRSWPLGGASPGRGTPRSGAGRLPAARRDGRAVRRSSHRAARTVGLPAKRIGGRPGGQAAGRPPPRLGRGRLAWRVGAPPPANGKQQADPVSGAFRPHEP